ncbi:MAG TPA: WYL domain-containing protein [Candidatus Binataceae bacterium]|nr:WYL domain-containing protein [Candidatus Binataceae bacterium]
MASKSRKPNYASAIRYARIAMMLHEEPLGVPLARLTRELQVSARTVDRYAREFMLMRGRLGQAIVEAVGSGPSRKLRLVARRSGPSSNVYQAAALYLSLEILRFLEGTVLQSGVDDIWERVRSNLPPSWQFRLRDFDRKFYAVQYVPRDYRPYERQIDMVLRALLEEKRLRIGYAAMNRIGGGELVHDFDPYTLVQYRGGLYLLGRSHRGSAIIYLAVERMRAVEFIKDPSGGDEKFKLPASYNPAAFVQGAFGIVTEQHESAVVLKSLSAETDARLRARTVHPSQKLSTARDGRTLVKLKVKGTAELANWIMAMNPYLAVLEPAALRREIKARTRATMRLYQQRGGARA